MADFTPFGDEKHKPFLLEGSENKVAILVHGFPGTPYEMRLIGEILNSLDYTVHGLLLPGFGRDIQNLGKRSKMDWINAIKEVLIPFKNNYTETLLLGYSFGGALSINLIDLFPELQPDKLILIAPFWDLFAQYNIFIRILGPIVWPIGRLFSPDIKVYENVDFDDPDQRKDIEQAFNGIDLDKPEVRKFLKKITLPFKILDEVYRIGKFSRKKIKNIRTDILVLQGTNDKIVTPQATKKLIKNIKVDYQYREIKNMTHEFIRPDHLNRDVLDKHLSKFLK